jgi:hypothetical protein
MAVTVVRYKTKPDRADENQAFIEKVFAELAADHPEGLRYVAVRLADGVSFVHVASVETADGSNPLGAQPAFGAFQREIADRLEEGPIVVEGTIVGSYRFATDGNPD